MNIGIIGYGKMGKLIHRLAEESGMAVSNIVDLDRGTIEEGVDVYIDFARAEGIQSRVEACGERGIPMVIGTTGWEEHKNEVERIVKESGNTVIYGSNFSLGVNIFWEVVREATKRFGAFADEYDIMVHEYHHKHKADSPSGTAKTIAEIICEEHPIKDTAIFEAPQRALADNELHVSATRGGNIPGTHEVVFDGVADSIVISEIARSREGFARGALTACRMIRDVGPGLHNFKNVIFK